MRTFLVANRLIKQIVADKRTIGLLLFAPIFVIYLLSVILTASSSTAPSGRSIAEPCLVTRS